MTSTWGLSTPLGRTQIEVGRLGLGDSYGAPAAVYEEAFERGFNYFHWGSFRRPGMRMAIRDLGPAHREDLVVVVQSLARGTQLLRRSLESALRELKTSYADVLLLGWHDGMPSQRLLDEAFRLVEIGRVRHIGISSHSVNAFGEFLKDPRIEVWHVRYNAAHRSAETAVFPRVQSRRELDRPGVVSFTSTRWGSLCDPRCTPPGEPTPTGTDCYRFALSHPSVDLVLCGPANRSEAMQAFSAAELGPMNEAEESWMRRIGDHVAAQAATGGLLSRANDWIRRGQRCWKSIQGE